MDLKLLQKILRMMSRGDVRELEIDDTEAGLRIHVRRGPGEGEAAPGGQPGLIHPAMQAQMVPWAAPIGAGGPAGPGAVVPPAGDALAAGEDDDELPEGVEEFLSPMVGTFYRAPAPDADPFVAVGEAFGEDTVLCVIEAMKVMNEIKAESVGEIVEALADNGEPVEFGQPLFLVKKS